MGGYYHDDPEPQEQAPRPKFAIYSKQSFINTSSSNPRQTISFLKSTLIRTGKLHEGLDPSNYTQQGRHLECPFSNPIVIALDVTSSMIEWAKVVQQKLPMFCGQIYKHKYLNDPVVSICAVGDATCDIAPLQVTKFAQGKQLNELVDKIWMEGGGGGNNHQSYELAAYFYNRYVDFKAYDTPIFFMTADEFYFEDPDVELYRKFLGAGFREDSIDTKLEWENLQKRYNVLLLRKTFSMANMDTKIYKRWVDTVGAERILEISNVKAIVDVMLGAISLTSGRSLAEYVEDMQARGQDKQRVGQVCETLKHYSKALEERTITPIRAAAQNRAKQ